MNISRTIAFWIFVYLAVTPMLSSVLVLAGRAPAFPVFQTFGSAPPAWRIAFFLSGVIAAFSAYLIRKNKRTAAIAAVVFLALFIPSFRVVWGQIALGIWLAVLATVLTMFVSLKSGRNEL